MTFPAITKLPDAPSKPDAVAQTWNDAYLEIDANFDLLENAVAAEFWNGQTFAVPSGTGSTNGHVINNEGTPVTQRVNLDFVGASVVAADGSGNTEVTINGAVLGMNIESITANKTLTDASEPIQALTPSAAWDVNLPAEATTNPYFMIINPSGSGFTLTVKDDSPATIATVADGETKVFIPDGITWYVLAGGGMNDLVDDLTPQFGGNVDMNGNNYLSDVEISKATPKLTLDETTSGNSFEISVINSASGIVDWDIIQTSTNNAAIRFFRNTPAAAAQVSLVVVDPDSAPSENAIIGAKGVDSFVCGLNGDFGIGTISPTEQAHVKGNLRVETGQAFFGKQTLTPGATVDWNMDSGPFAQLTLGQNTTINAPTNIEIGATYILKVINGASWTITFNAIFKFPGGTAPTQTVGASNYDIYTFVSFDGTNLEGVQVQDFS